MAQAPEPLSALGAAPSLDAGNNLSRVQAPASAFGGDSADALARGGARVSSAAEELNTTLLAQQGLQNETMANDARNNAVLAASKRLAVYKSLEGQNAVAGFDQYQSDIQDIFKGAGATLSNPSAQRMYNQVSGRYVANYLQDAVGHSVSEDKKWQRQSQIATQETAANTAVQFRNDPAKVGEQMDVAADAAVHLSEMAGEDAATAQAKAAIARGKVLTSVVGTLAADPSTVFQAETLFRAAQGSVDAPTAARLAEHLRPKLERAQTDSDFLTVTHQAPAVVPGNVSFDNLWSAQKLQESGGQHFKSDGTVQRSVLPPEKGGDAIGVSQIQVGTARDVAGRLGVPFDAKRLETDPLYNELLGKAYMGEMQTRYGDPNLALAAYNAGPGRMDEWLKTYGDPRKGQISMADFIAKIPYAETRNYIRDINRRLSGTQPTDGSATPDATQQRIDGPAMIRQATDMTAGDPERQARLLSRVTTYIHQQDSAQAQQRAALIDYTTDLGVQFMDGNPNAQAVPEQQIRALLAPDKAEALIANLNAKLTAGKIFQGVALADPATVAAMRADLETGNGVFSNMLKGKGTLLRGDTGAATGPVFTVGTPAGLQAAGNIDITKRPPVRNADGSVSTVRSLSFEENGKEVLIPTVVDGKVVSDAEAIEHYRKTGEHLGKFDTPANATAYAEALHNQQATALPDTQQAADYRVRKQIAALLEDRLAARSAAIKADPAAYVMNQDPMVKALVPGQDATPQDWQNYATSTLAAQARLGVPDYQRTILPVAQADAIVRTFTTQTPDKMNAQQMLAGLAQRYGNQWNNVLGQLVKQKLPGEYQVLAMMDAPNQVGPAAELQQALVVEFGTKGGRQAIKDGIDQPKRRDIEDGITKGLAPFLATVVENGAGGRTTYAHVQNAVEALAFSYAQRGKSASEAVKAAVDGVINEHYDVRNSYRIPRFIDGKSVSSDNVVSAAEAIQRSLTVADLRDIGGGTVPGLTAADRQAAALAAAQGSNAKWVNNERDDGLVLLSLTKGGRYEPVQRADGGRVEFKFANPPASELINTGSGMEQRLRPISYTYGGDNVAGPDNLRSRTYDAVHRTMGAPNPASVTERVQASREFGHVSSSDKAPLTDLTRLPPIELRRDLVPSPTELAPQRDPSKPRRT